MENSQINQAKWNFVKNREVLDKLQSPGRFIVELEQGVYRVFKRHSDESHSGKFFSKFKKSLREVQTQLPLFSIEVEKISQTKIKIWVDGRHCFDINKK